MIDFEVITDAKSFRLALKQTYAEVYNKLDHNITELGTDAAEIARKIAPKDEGTLREGIFSYADAKGRTKLRNDTTKNGGKAYGAYVEWGTARTAPQPHLLPGVRLAKKNTLAKIAREGAL